MPVFSPLTWLAVLLGDITNCPFNLSRRGFDAKAGRLRQRARLAIERTPGSLLNRPRLRVRMYVLPRVIGNWAMLKNRTALSNRRGRAITAKITFLIQGNPFASTTRLRTSRIRFGNCISTGQTVSQALQLTHRL